MKLYDLINKTTITYVTSDHTATTFSGVSMIYAFCFTSGRTRYIKEISTQFIYTKFSCEVILYCYKSPDLFIKCCYTITVYFYDLYTYSLFITDPGRIYA